MEKPLQRIVWLATFFSIAMGFLEGAVVVYLRMLYYPEGFGFPMVPIDDLAATTELLREAATIIMLTTFGAIAGTSTVQRFGFFLFAFGVWDLTYYAVLKLLLDWPSTIMEWDILFLIPVPWFAPVLAPCIISLLLMTLSFQLFCAPPAKLKSVISASSWVLLVAGSAVVIFSFIIDYLQYAYPLLVSGKMKDEQMLLSELSLFVPENYRWWIFITGVIIIITGMINIHNTQKKLRQDVDSKSYS